MKTEGDKLGNNSNFIIALLPRNECKRNLEQLLFFLKMQEGQIIPGRQGISYRILQ